MSAGSGDDDSLISTRNSSRWVRRSPRVRVAAEGRSTCNGSHFMRVRIPAHNPSNFLKALARAGTNRRATKIVVKKIFLLPPSASKGKTKFQLIKKSAGSWSTYPRVAANVSCWFKLTLGSEMKLTKAVAVEDDRNKKQESDFEAGDSDPGSTLTENPKISVQRWRIVGRSCWEEGGSGRERTIDWKKLGRL